MSRKLFIVAALLSLAFAVPADATTITIDDFSSPTLDANWVQSTVLLAGSPGPYTFDATSNPGELTATMSSYAATARQDVFLRKDRGLQVGETLVLDLDIAKWSTNSTTSPLEIWGGLAIALDTGINERKDFMFLAYSDKSRSGPIYSSSLVGCDYWNHDGQRLTPSPVRQTVSARTVDELYIYRSSANEYEIGYHKIGDENRTAIRTMTVDSSYTLGAAVGIYADHRFNGTTVFDNLRIENAVPEPSTLALLAAGLVGLLAYAWRKRK